jgi:hypothetical protein
MVKRTYQTEKGWGRFTYKEISNRERKYSAYDIYRRYFDGSRSELIKAWKQLPAEDRKEYQRHANELNKRTKEVKLRKHSVHAVNEEEPTVSRSKEESTDEDDHSDYGMHPKQTVESKFVRASILPKRVKHEVGDAEKKGQKLMALLQGLQGKFITMSQYSKLVSFVASDDHAKEMDVIMTILSNDVNMHDGLERWNKWGAQLVEYLLNLF